MKLTHLTDQALLSDTKQLVTQERKLGTQVLYHLREVEKRRLFSDLGFASLYDYCQRELGYSAPAAHRRIVSARLLEEMPEIEGPITNGSLSLSNIAMAAGFLKDVVPEKKKRIIKQIENMSARECEKMLFQLSGNQLPPVKEKEKRLDVSTKAVTIILKDATLEKVQMFKDLSGIASWDASLARMSTLALDQLKKTKFKLVNKPGKPSEGKGRYISASVKREVYQRDQVCQQCGTIYKLHYDHREPHSMGGENTAENIRLLCFSCNQRARIRARL